MTDLDPRRSVGVHAGPSDLGSVGSVARAWLGARLPGLLARCVAERRVDVLDVGCGSGVLALQLRRLGVAGTYLGCDLARHPAWDEIEAAESQLRAEFALLPAERVGELGRAFDLVVSIMAFEHVEDDAEAMRSLAQVLAEEGTILLAVPAAGSRFYLGRRHSFRWYDRARLESLANVAGLELEEVLEQRSGLGLLLDALRYELFVWLSRLARWSAYAAAGGRKDVARRRFRRAVELKLELDDLWNRAWEGRLARAAITLGLAADRVVAPVPVSYLAVFRPGSALRESPVAGKSG